MIHHAIVPSFSERTGTTLQHITPGTVNALRRGNSECLPVESPPATAERTPGTVNALRRDIPERLPVESPPATAERTPATANALRRGNSECLPVESPSASAERTPGTINALRRDVPECLPVESTSATTERSPEGAANSVRSPAFSCTEDGAAGPGQFTEHCRGISNCLPVVPADAPTARVPQRGTKSDRNPTAGPGQLIEHCRGISNCSPVVPADAPTARVLHRGTKSDRNPTAGPGQLIEHCRGISNCSPVVPADAPTARVLHRGTKSDRIPAHYSTHVGAQVPTAKVHEIIATGPFEQRFKVLWHDLFYREIPTGQGHHHFCALRDKDVKALLQAKTIRIPAPGEYESLEDTCSVFIVPEHPKQRVRVITWTQDTNDIVYESDFSLKAPRDVILESHGAVAALILDLAAAFYQFAIPQSQQWRFAFSFRGVRYVFTKLPMGARQSAELCNIFLSSILHLAGAYENGAKVTVHIDNARIIGSHDHVRSVRLRCMKICAQYDVTFGEITVAQQKQNPLYDFLGVRYDMGEGTITIPPAKQQRLWICFRDHLHTWSTRTRLSKSETTPRYVATRREIVSLVSKTSVAAAIVSTSHIPFQVCLLYATMQALRASRCDTWDEEVTIPLEVIINITAFVVQVTSRRIPVAICHPAMVDLVWLLTTDASGTGAAAHLANHDHTLFHSVIWHKALTINQAELAIMLAAIRKWLPKLKGGTLVIATDSQVAIQAITNGRSDTPEIDKLAKRICKRLADAHVTVVFRKVPTKKNPMDAPSRDKEMKWQSLLEHFTLCMEEGIFEERGASPSE
jgi:ribonuclease HI